MRFRNEDYENKERITTRLTANFWGRIKFLFCTHVMIEHEVYMDVKPTKTDAELHFKVTTIFDKIEQRYCNQIAPPMPLSAPALPADNQLRKV